MRLAQEEGRWYVVSRQPLAGEVDGPVLPEEFVSPIEIRAIPDPHGASPHSAPSVQGAASQAPAPPK
jgi:hypothetical protein